MKFIFTLCAVVLLNACNNSTEIASSIKDIPNAMWVSTYIPDFSFNVTNTQIYYKVNLIITVNKQYPYENIYILTHVKDSEGKIVYHKQNYSLFDATGKPKGSIHGSSATYEIPMFSDFKANKPGVHFIALEMNMRDSVLKGVENIGINVKEGKTIF